MSDYMHIIVLLVAFAADAVLGDPQYPLHPVRLIGHAISQLKRGLFEIELNGKAGGTLMTIVIILLSVNIYLLFRLVAENIHPMMPVAVDIFFLYSSIALKDMFSHVKPVLKLIDNNDLPAARIELQKIVGRKTGALDAQAVVKATIESTAESFVDGFLAPVLWYTITIIAGQLTTLVTPPIAVCAAIIYRTTNTMDSMIGHKDEEFLKFGWFAARLDDALNFIPARLSPLFLTPAALLCGLNVQQAWRITMRDRLKHESPNSAHAESFTAGALGVKLGGPTEYPDGIVDKPWIGDGSQEITTCHARKTCRMIMLAGWISMLISAIVML